MHLWFSFCFGYIETLFLYHMNFSLIVAWKDLLFGPVMEVELLFAF